MKSLGWSEADSPVTRQLFESTYDPTDIATDEESDEKSCQCIIHNRRARTNGGTGHALFYKTGGAEDVY